MLDADGSRVVFVSQASDLGPPNSTSGTFGEDVYVRDLTTRTTTLVSTNATGTDSADERSGQAAITPDGSRVVFASRASDLGMQDLDHEWDIFVGTLFGADPAEDVVVAVLLPEGAEVVTVDAVGADCAPLPSGEPQVITCAVGDMVPGSTAHVEVSATVTGPAGTVLTTTTAVVDPTNL